MTDEVGSSDWMVSVAHLLQFSHRAARSYTLGESVIELGSWAREARTESWTNKGNRSSLDQDLTLNLPTVGPRLWAIISDLIPQLRPDVDRATVAQATAEFSERWSHRDSVIAAFRDLCEAAATGSYGTRNLKPMAEILRSQLRERHQHRRVLQETSTWLSGEPHCTDLEYWLGPGSSLEDLTPSVRIETASELLSADPPTGRVIVWLLYRRARIPIRVAAGPITFLHPGWAIPNAMDNNGQDFEEREEVRALVDDPFGVLPDELTGDAAAIEQYALARVDLGERRGGGAADEATRRVEALLSIASNAGGVSWVNTGASTTIIDGRPYAGSLGLVRSRHDEDFHDHYGLNATAELLTYWAERLDTSLTRTPMPDFLVEALTSVREASMTNHRDVLFYDESPTTPRVAVALEDHAMELIASIAGMNPEALLSHIEEDEVDERWEKSVINGLIDPIRVNYYSPHASQEAETLQRIIMRFDSGFTNVSLEQVWAARSRLRALPVPPVVRTSLEEGLGAISSTAEEQKILTHARQSVRALRDRHRRVRNAITHGNPVSTASIENVREFSARIAQNALGLALHSYASGKPLLSLLSERQTARLETRRAMDSGINRIERSAAAKSAAANASEVERL